MRMKQKLNWDIFSLGLRLKASLPGKRIRTSPAWHGKGVTGTYWQRIQATFPSFTPTPSITERLAICLLQHNVASQVCSLLTGAGLLHVSIGPIVMDLLCPSHVWALCRVLTIRPWTKQTAFSQRPHSAMRVTNKDANKCTDVFRLRRGLVGGCSTVKATLPGWPGKASLGKCCFSSAKPQGGGPSTRSKKRGRRDIQRVKHSNALISALAFYLPNQLQRGSY